MNRNIMLTLAVLLMIAGLAYAADVPVATFGDANSSGEYRVKSIIDSATGNGTVVYAIDTGIQYPYEHYTTANTNNSLNDYESGKTITDTGGSSDAAMICEAGEGGSKHILPRAEPGLEFTLTTGAKCSVTLDAFDTSDQILFSISGTVLDAGDSLKSTGQAGDSVTVFSTVANKWSIKQMKGSWTDNGTN